MHRFLFIAPCVFVLIYLSAVLILGISPALASDQIKCSQVNCDIQQGPCTQPLGQGMVCLDIQPRPVKAMVDLTFTVTLTDLATAADPTIDLGMPGMKMGPNRVHLKKTETGAFTGTGIIVRCPSGRTLWKAAVTIPNHGQADFIFHVIY